MGLDVTGTAADVLAVAAGVVGQVESPAGSNRCPITDELDATFPRVPLANGGTSTRGGTSWCSSANLWWLWKGGVVVDPRGCTVVNGVDIWHFYTPADVNGWKRAGRWMDWRDTPPPGALVYYDWQGTHGSTSSTDHTGIVVEADGRGLTTIEGNTSPSGFVSNGGGVYLFGPGQRSAARPLSMVVGYGLPDYTPVIPTDPSHPEVDTVPKRVTFGGQAAIFIGDFDAASGRVTTVRWLSPQQNEFYAPTGDVVDLPWDHVPNVACLGPAPSFGVWPFARVINEGSTDLDVVAADMARRLGNG